MSSLSVNNTKEFLLNNGTGKFFIILICGLLLAIAFSIHHISNLFSIVVILFCARVHLSLKKQIELLTAKESEAKTSLELALCAKEQNQNASCKIASVLSIGSNQLMTTTQMANETAEDLANKFVQLDNKMNDSISLSQSVINRLTNKDDSLITHNEEKLIEIVESLKYSLNDKASHISSNKEVSEAANNLKNQTESIIAISKEISLLSLNASIEAARAGESGRGFAVVAERIRELSDTTSNAATEIIDRMNILSSAIERNNSSLENSATRDNETIDRANENISGVLTSFKNLNDELNETVHSLELCANESKALVESVITDIQFQDRVSQKIHHVSTALESLTALYENYEAFNVEEVVRIENDLYSSYTMNEERSCHLSTTVTESDIEAKEHTSDNLIIF